MLKYFSFIVWLFVTLNAQSTVIIDSDNVKITDFKMSYYVDKTQKLPFDEIVKKDFTESSNKISLGKTSNVTWAKVVINNSTDTDKNIFLHNPFAYAVKHVHFYEVENSKLLNESTFDLNTKDGATKMYGKNAIFSVKLQPNEIKTIYMKSSVFAYQYFSLMIYDEGNSKRAMSGMGADIAMLVGILLALAFYNIILYYSSKHTEHIYYSLYLVSASVWIALLYGLLADVFGAYGEGVYLLTFALLFLPIFLTLFIQSIFNTKNNYKTEHMFLNSVLIIFMFNALYGFFNFFKSIEIFSQISIYMVVVFLFVSISIYKKENILAKYFLIGHVFFLIFSSISILFYDGFIEFNYITSHAAGIGIVLESLMLAYVVSYKIKLLQDAKTELLNTLEEQVKKRTQELEYSNYQFAHVLDNTMEGIAIFENNKSVDANNSAIKLYGYDDKSSLMGVNILNFIAPKNHAKVMENVKNNYELPYEVFGIKKDGSEFPLLAKGHTFIQGDKKLRIVSFMDLTKIKENEKQLELAKDKAEESTRVKSSFLANMSHEIRTPMNGIIGMTHLVKKTKLDDKQKNYIEKIETASNNLLNIINDILDFSKMESGKLSIDKIDFDMNEVIQNVRNLVEFKAVEKSLKFSVIFSQEDSIFYGDPLRIGQVLINLLNNGVKFTHFGEVELLIEPLEDEMVQFTVSDTGIGLSIEQQIKLFQSFNQADPTITRKYGGTGLGLSVSKQLVELMDGTIWVESEEGFGSEFIFEIKLPKGDKENIKKISDGIDFNYLSTQIGTLRGSNILLVEDNSINREIIHSLLEDSQINIDDAFDGAMAVELFEKNADKYELILMDLQMPIMDGFESAKIIRETNKNIPIIALTANAMKEDAQRTQQAGMNEHLNKPIDVEKLYATLLKYISKKVHNEDITLKRHADVIPEFVTINTKKGLKLLGGNKKLYLKILNDFLTNYKDRDLDTMSHSEFKRTIHTLKGLSANIGALKLYEITKELDETQNKGLLHLWHVEMDKVLSELAKVSVTRADETKKELIAQAKRDELFEKLKETVATNRPKECEPIIEELQKYKLQKEDEVVFMNVKQLLRRYKFKEALEVLK